jgi:hypothetical protein
MKKEAIKIGLEEYRKEKQKWLERSMEEPIVVVDDEGKMLFRMQLIGGADPEQAAAE